MMNPCGREWWPGLVCVCVAANLSLGPVLGPDSSSYLQDLSLVSLPVNLSSTNDPCVCAALMTMNEVLAWSSLHSLPLESPKDQELS